jgi:hypothetical protein
MDEIMRGIRALSGLSNATRNGGARCNFRLRFDRE